MRRLIHPIRHLLLLALILAPAGLSVRAVECTFLNPLIPFGADPSVIYHDDSYYMVQSNGTGLSIIQSETITGLDLSQARVVYTAPPGQPYSYDLWGPELEYLDGQWYIYVAATDSPGNNALHRMYVLQADTSDPMGTWTMRGKVYDPQADVWSIDGSVFDYEGQLYMVWSGWPEFDSGFPQNLYIAEMSDPLTISSQRVLIGEPDQSWERSVEPINEGPQPFIYQGQLSIVYSADASWTSAYKLAILHLTGNDPLDAKAWSEIGPVFEQVTDSQTPIFGPGHNSDPIPSPDGEEFWFLYHAKTVSTPGWEDRAIYAQEISWSEEGLPILDDPIPAEIAQPVPSGEPCGLIATFDNPKLSESSQFFDTGEALVSTQGSFSIAARVRLTDLDSHYAFVSQEGGISSNFVLGYRDGQFTFTMFNPFGQNAVSAQADLVVEPDVWYHLIGTYNATDHQLSLYIDGELREQATFSEVWDAVGNTVIGAARRQSQRVDIFTGGTIEDVQVFNGALEAAEIQTLFANLLAPALD
jgi:GH43 family beta-xylosidase